jgi:hypothetical protein
MAESCLLEASNGERPGCRLLTWRTMSFDEGQHHSMVTGITSLTIGRHTFSFAYAMCFPQCASSWRDMMSERRHRI